MISASFRTFSVDGTATATAVEVKAVAVGHAGQGKGLALAVVMLHHLLLHQATGNEFGIFLQLEGIYQTDPNKISGLHLHRQTAAGAAAAVTELLGIFAPGISIFGIGPGLGRHVLALFFAEQRDKAVPQYLDDVTLSVTVV